MRIERPAYLKKLIQKRENGLIKVITGIRRCGKSYLLFEIYRDHLLESGVAEEQIIGLALDEISNAKYRNPLELDKYIREQITDKSKMYYVFLDEIQKVVQIQNPYVDHADSQIGFVDVVLGLMKIKNVDLYITGSNSRMLSSDILTEFRDRGDEVRVGPLSYKEFLSVFDGDRSRAWSEYYTYGGMPLVLARKSHDEKSRYLKDLFTRTYLTDVLERHRVLNEKEVLEDLLNILSSSVGSLTNPSKLSKTFESVKHVTLSPATVGRYLDFFSDAFLIAKAFRYDIKGKKYIDSPLKYYFTDVGLRNARLNFRQQEENHIMENILYNELTAKGCDVDVGIVEHNTKTAAGKSERIRLEVDFVANRGSNRCYIQSALNISEESKRRQEVRSLLQIRDSFRKIVVTKDPIVPWYDENGVFYIGIEQFLLDEHVLDG